MLLNIFASTPYLVAASDRRIFLVAGTQWNYRKPRKLVFAESLSGVELTEHGPWTIKGDLTIIRPVVGDTYALEVNRAYKSEVDALFALFASRPAD